jgi:hypothetical protein
MDTRVFVHKIFDGKAIFFPFRDSEATADTSLRKIQQWKYRDKEWIVSEVLYSRQKAKEIKSQSLLPLHGPDILQIFEGKELKALLYHPIYSDRLELVYNYVNGIPENHKHFEISNNITEDIRTFLGAEFIEKLAEFKYIL